MKCPVDGETLVMTDRSGVEIDYCPRCRGVWLDRGELDKIIDRAAVPMAPVPPAGQPTAAPDLHGEPQFRRSDAYRADSRDDRRRDHDDDHDDHYRHGKRKRRDSFLGDLFDF